MTIRPATPADLPQVQALIAHIVQNTTITFTTQIKSLADLGSLVDQGRLLVTTQNADVAGYASFGPFRAGPGYAHVAEHSIVLHPSAQGQGRGRALMDRLVAIAQTQGIQILIAAVSSSNPAGLAFHQAMGFAQVGHLPGVGRKFGQSLDLLLLQKTLSPPQAPSLV